MEEDEECGEEDGNAERGSLESLVREEEQKKQKEAKAQHQITRDLQDLQARFRRGFRKAHIAGVLPFELGGIVPLIDPVHPAWRENEGEAK